jgi:hypothetical protein
MMEEICDAMPCRPGTDGCCDDDAEVAAHIELLNSDDRNS